MGNPFPLKTPIKRWLKYFMMAGISVTSLTGVSLPAQAGDLADTNGVILFNEDTEGTFKFLLSHGFYKSVYGLVEVDSGDKIPLFSERLPYEIYGDEYDWQGTSSALTDLNVPKDTVVFTFKAGVKYQMGLWGKQPVPVGHDVRMTDAKIAYGSYTFKRTGPNWKGPIVYDTVTATNPDGSPAMIVGFEDGYEPARGKEGDFNDLIVTVSLKPRVVECYAVADNDQLAGSPDVFLELSYVTGQAEYVGPTNTAHVESLTFDLKGNIVYAVNGGQFGTIDIKMGKFTPIGSVGTGNGEQGEQKFDDIDGITFDVATGIVYAIQRREHAEQDWDLLLQIDPLTGSVIRDAFGPSKDYVPITGTEMDIDDIASDPTNGKLYAISNRGDGLGSVLVTIDKTNGHSTLVGKNEGGTGNVEDIEGLTFLPDGMLYGSSGKSSSQGPAADLTRNRLYLIDKATGRVSLVGTWTGQQDARVAVQQDVEGLACRPKQRLENCVMYALHDEKLNDSQLIAIDPFVKGVGVVSPLGPLHKAHDIEGVAILPSKTGSGTLYGSSGSDGVAGVRDGFIYKIDRKTGELTDVGSTGFHEVSALAVDRADNTLWGWARGSEKTVIVNGKSKKVRVGPIGPIKIDPETGKGSLAVPTGTFLDADGYKLSSVPDIEAIAWSNGGGKLYAMSGRVLWAFEPQTNGLSKVCSKTVDAEVEALEMQPNGILLLGTDSDKDGGMIGIQAFDPVSCQVVASRIFKNLPYTDIESIAWPSQECAERSWLYQGSWDAEIELIKYDAVPQEAEDGIRIALQEAGFTDAVVEANHGKILVYMGDLTFVAQPVAEGQVRDGERNVAIESATIVDKGVTNIVLSVDLGNQTALFQLVPAASNETALENAIGEFGKATVQEDSGVITVNVESTGQTISVVPDLAVEQPSVTEGQSLETLDSDMATIDSTGDKNNDGTSDFVVTYPNGDTQVLYNVTGKENQ